MTVPTRPKQAFDTYTYGRNSSGTWATARAAKNMHTSMSDPVIGLMIKYRVKSHGSAQLLSICQPSQVDQRSVRAYSVAAGWFTASLPPHGQPAIPLRLALQEVQAQLRPGQEHDGQSAQQGDLGPHRQHALGPEQHLAHRVQI